MVMQATTTPAVVQQMRSMLLLLLLWMWWAAASSSSSTGLETQQHTILVAIQQQQQQQRQQAPHCPMLQIGVQVVQADKLCCLQLQNQLQMHPVESCIAPVVMWVMVAAQHFLLAA
jgi:hypothetical protein